MKSAYLVECNKIEIRDIPIPTPSDGELLIQIKAGLTCGTDLKAYLRGHHVIPMPGPFGHEFSGIVAEAGKGVKGFKTGDEVMAVHSAPCLKCRYCNKRLYNLCEDIMESKVLGAFAEYVILPSHIVKQNVYIKPRRISFEEAAFMEPLACVLHGMNGLEISKKDNVLVIGAGPIGLLHLLALKAKGAKVTMMDLNGKRLRFAKSIGADCATKTPKTDIGFDYIFECTGIPDVWERSLDYARRGATVTLFGGCPSGTKATFDTARIHYDELTLKGVFHFTPADVRASCEMLSKRRIDVRPLVSGSYKLGSINKAFERLQRGEGIKYAIVG